MPQASSTCDTKGHGKFACRYVPDLVRLPKAFVAPPEGWNSLRKYTLHRQSRRTLPQQFALDQLGIPASRVEPRGPPQSTFCTAIGSQYMVGHLDPPSAQQSWIVNVPLGRFVHINLQHFAIANAIETLEGAVRLYSANSRLKVCLLQSCQIGSLARELLSAPRA